MDEYEEQINILKKTQNTLINNNYSFVHNNNKDGKNISKHRIQKLLNISLSIDQLKQSSY